MQDCLKQFDESRLFPRTGPVLVNVGLYKTPFFKSRLHFLVVNRLNKGSSVQDHVLELGYEAISGVTVVGLL